MLSNLPNCFKKKPGLENKIQGAEEQVSKAKLAKAEDDLSISQQELRGLSFQIDAHHREDDSRREKNHSRGDDMEGVFVEDVGYRLMGVKGVGWAGLAVVRVLQKLLRVTFWSFCVACRRRTRPLSSGTMVRMEATTCLLLRVTNLKLMFMVRI